MPNIAYIQHSFNVGEVSNRMLARLDQNKYLGACEVLENWTPLAIGGAKRTEGTRFVTSTKLSGTGTNEGVRLIRFVFSNTQAYVMEFGHLYVRFFKEVNGLGSAVLVPPAGPAVLELVTPWTAADLSRLMPYQSGDVIYIPSGIYQVQKISRIALAPENFTITEVNFDAPATIPDEPTGTELGPATLTPGATTGSGIVFTASAAVFLAGDVGRIIIFAGSRAVIVSVVNATQVTADIIDDFPNTNPIPAADWRLRLSPRTDLDPSGRAIGSVITLVSSLAAFRSADAGKFIALYGGFVRINSVDSTTQVTGTVKSALKDATVDDPVATPAWSIEKVAWNATDLYATTGCFFEERMWLARGTRIWGSIVGDFENFAKGSSADDGIARVISDNEINPIMWIAGSDKLTIATTSGAYVVTAAADKALTPADFNVRPVSDKGAARILPLRISGVFLYIHSSQKRLRELVFDFATDKYKSPNVLFLADHLTEDFKIKELAFEEEPDSIIHALREDGQLISIVYQSEENAIGASRRVTDGDIVSVCVIPRVLTGESWVWIAVRRSINGIVKTYLETFEPKATDVNRKWIDLQTHCAKVTTHDVNFLVTGLSHLESERVRVIGDGLLFNDAIVTGGQFTITPTPAAPLTSVEVGLNYDSLIRLPEPILPMDAGGPLMCRGYSEIGIRVRRTLGLNLGIRGHGEIDGEPLYWRRPEHTVGIQVPLQKGKRCIPVIGNDDFQRIEIKQLLPFPAEVLGTLCQLHIGDRSCCFSEDDSPDIAPVVDPTPPGVCPDINPAFQDLPVVCCYISDGFGDVSPNSAGMFAHVAEDNTFWCTVSEMSGFPSGPYPNAVPTRTWYLLKGGTANCNLTEDTPVALQGGRVGNFQSTQTPQTGTQGKSDEKCYHITISSLNPQVNDSEIANGPGYIVGNVSSAKAYFGAVSGCSLYWTSDNTSPPLGRAWCKFSNKIYSPISDGFHNLLAWASWPCPGVSYEDQRVAIVNVIPDYVALNIYRDRLIGSRATQNFIYILTGTNLGTVKLYKISRSTFLHVQDWTLDMTGFAFKMIQFDCVTDDFFYFHGDNLPGVASWSFGYWRPSAGGPIVKIGEVGRQCVFNNGDAPTDQNSFIHKNGYFYIGYSGAIVGDPNVLKVGPVRCPSNPALIFDPEP